MPRITTASSKSSQKTARTSRENKRLSPTRQSTPAAPKKRTRKKVAVVPAADDKKILLDGVSVFKKGTTAKVDHRDSPITLPVNMSRRAIAKSAAFMSELDLYLAKPASLITYISGLCFIVVGAAYTSFALVQLPTYQKAEIVSVTDISVSSGTTETDPAASGETTSAGGTLTSEETITSDGTVTTNSLSGYPTPKSEFVFLTDIPDNIIQPTAVSFEATYASEVACKLVQLDGATYKLLPVERLSIDKYKVIVPQELLLPGYYELRILVKPLDGSTGYVRVSDDFFVGSEEVEKIYNSEDAGVNDPTLSTDSSSSGSGTSGSEEEVGTEAVTTTSDEPDESTVETAEAITTSVAPATTLESSSTPLTDFTLSSPNGSTLTETATLRVFVPEGASFIELYARPVSGLSGRFVTLATKRLDRWVFVFDSKNIPNGDYEFFGKTKVDGKLLTSRSLRLSIKNSTVIVSTIEPVDFTTSSDDDTSRQLVTVDSEPYVPPMVMSKVVEVESRELILKSSGELNDLLERYAIAVQSGDPALIEAAKRALELKRDAIMLSTINDVRVGDISDNINTVVTDQFATLQKRVEVFEELRKQRSDGTSAVDTDGDGVSDLDEIKLYSTDPSDPDSDGDGVTDGIEIIRGFDPHDAQPEAVIRFQSPIESLAVVRSDVFEVHEVLPVLREDQSEVLPTVTAEIRGRGLPNSFVTLYIFSTPTVVTVKTNADGLFVYTFDKELEDGQHEVYVAMTDNAGEIVARSNPFSFVKEAQAFTPVAASEGVIISPEPIAQSSGGGYQIAVGLAVLSFGLILLMLGITLRLNRKNEVVITENTPAAS